MVLASMMPPLRGNTSALTSWSSVNALIVADSNCCPRTTKDQPGDRGLLARGTSSE